MSYLEELRDVIRRLHGAEAMQSSLLARIGGAMQSPDQRRFSGGHSGGRVFLHSLGVVRSPSIEA